MKTAIDLETILAPLTGDRPGIESLLKARRKTWQEAKALTATDPVVVEGEMVAEFHKFYGSAALMLVNDGHARVARKPF